MFAGEAGASAKADAIIGELGSNSATNMHARHIHAAKAKSIGLKIVELDADSGLQDAVLSVRHGNMITFEQAGAFKMIESHIGSSYILSQLSVIAING